MDSFINLAQQGYKAYQSSQASNNSNPDLSKTGGQEYNSPHHSGQDGGQSGPNFNHDEVVNTAQNHGSGDPSLFSNAMGYVANNQHAHNDAVDEGGVQAAHDKAYGQNAGGDLSAHDIGGAAALQALKSFGSGGGGSQSQLISLAMAEATKLFDKFGGGSSGNKQDAVNGAAMTVMKLLVQSKFGGGAQTVGGSNSGGLSSLMGIASKFM